MNWIEIVGYIASILVAVSLTMSNIKRLRWYNLVGCAVFSTYGLLVKAYPVFAVNGFIAIVNLYYLIRMYKHQDDYSTLSVGSDDKFLGKFLSYWDKDIRKYFPEYELKDNDRVFFIIRNSLPVGLFVSRTKNQNEAHVIVDYAIPDYRDLGNSKFFFSQHLETLRLCKISRLVAETEEKSHKDYLKKIGFNSSNNSKFEYVLN